MPASEVPEPVRVAVDLARPGEPLTRSWELVVGSGDAWSLLRADLQEQLRRAVQDCGFRYLRCHGILCDQLQVIRRDRAGELIYNWQMADDVYDALLDIGLRPFVELAFMPSALASGDQTVFYYRANVTPPADYARWRALVTDLVSHWRDRYGPDELRRWYFEVWNEANLPAFWSGSQDEYFRLYAEAAAAIKAVDPAFRVGGPATSRAEWLTDFVTYCRRNAVPLDFVSTHVYPDDDDFEKTDTGYRAIYEQGDYLETVVERAVAELAALEPGGEARRGELHWTEWNSSWRWGREIHDLTNQAAYICRAIHRVHRLVDSFAYWTISDIFNEFPYPRSALVGGFGLLTIDGLPKPAYHAFTLLHRLGDEELRTTIRNPTSTPPGFDCWATRSADGIQVLVANYVPPRESGARPAVSVELRLEGLERGRSLGFTEYRVDADHASVRDAWAQLGSPETPTREQLDALRAASELAKADGWHVIADAEGTITLPVSVPAAGVIFLDLAFE